MVKKDRDNISFAGCDSSATGFSGKEKKLEKNIYATLKGRIRQSLVYDDIAVSCAMFERGGVRVLDIGGGSGGFAALCAERGHMVTLVDKSEEMIVAAQERLTRASLHDRVELRHEDFLLEASALPEQYDLVMMHGAAEWMENAQAAIVKACSCVRPGGILSLLVFNTDRLMLKRGINGDLLSGRMVRGGLTPPNSLSPNELESLLAGMGGSVELLSGVRIFYGFFRCAVDLNALSADGWLEQERRYARQEPFSRLGEHTHVIWRAD